ncbi:hypothetical protein STSP2_01606 [Anaerohalosphaera lusitana]|uniref:DUF456 domain-containing protein n=1 Tax=Anaerohalosphaera lusitana TaxID=1936003 RepID=A0A1U9NKI1_9BACT|nr:DUF456 domain-containing protein [Anaerohalosphaera lusitana]AQT68442.1 hypothetical protein STSP2_01606 [Anaerohalosphaera lusitana]
MLYVYVFLLVILNAFWLMFTFLALPGNWLVVLSTWGFAWWTWEERVFSVATLVVITVLAVIGEIIEFFAGMGGAKKAGASWLGAVGAIIGMVFGAVFGTVLLGVPFVGTLAGACVGAGIGAWGLEMMRGKEFEESFRFGLGAGIGTLIGTGSKFVLGVVIWIIVAVAGFVP